MSLTQKLASVTWRTQLNIGITFLLYVGSDSRGAGGAYVAAGYQYDSAYGAASGYKAAVS